MLIEYQMRESLKYVGRRVTEIAVGVGIVAYGLLVDFCLPKSEVGSGSIVSGLELIAGDKNVN